MDWFSHLCDFAGNFHQKHQDVPLDSILQYIVNRVRAVAFPRRHLCHLH
jgi:hypothetical protein